jgi:hypothetical protein
LSRKNTSVEKDERPTSNIELNAVLTWTMVILLQLTPAGKFFCPKGLWGGLRVSAAKNFRMKSVKGYL